MRIFAISMKDDLSRREYIIDECNRRSLNVEIIDAVVGKELTEQELKAAVFKYEECNFTRGEIGCALSHIKIYRKIVEDNIELALILEDDAILSDKINETLNDIETFNMKKKKPSLYLLTKVEKYISSRPKRLKHINLYRFYKGWCAAGYLINRKGAEILLKQLQPMRVVADHWLYIKFYTHITIYCVIPHIVGYKVESILEGERSKIDKAKRSRYHDTVLHLNNFSWLKWRLYRIFARPFFRVKAVEEQI